MAGDGKRVLHGIALAATGTKAGLAAAGLGALTKAVGLHMVIAHQLPLPVVLVCACIFFVVIQRPFRGTRLKRDQHFRIALHGALNALAWMAVVLCVALRMRGMCTALAVSEASHVISGVFAALTAGSALPSEKVRAALVGVAAMYFLLSLDQPSVIHTREHTQHTDVHVVRHGRSYGPIYLTDDTGGAFLLLLACLCRTVAAGIGRKLAGQIGGARRAQALSSVACAAASLFLWMLLPSSLSYSDPSSHNSETSAGQQATVLAPVAEGTTPDKTEAPSLAYTLLMSTLAAMMLVVAPFFASRKATTSTAKTHSVYAASCAVLLVTTAFIEHEMHSPTEPGLWTAIGMLLLVWSHRWHSSSHSTVGTSSRGTLIGYAHDGLPLYSVSAGTSQPGFLPSTRRLLKRVMDKRDSRWDLYCAAAVAACVLVMEILGWLTHSRVLQYNAARMVVVLGVLVCSLLSSIVSRPKKLPDFPFGLERVKILYAVTASLSVIVLSLWDVSEAAATRDKDLAKSWASGLLLPTVTHVLGAAITRARWFLSPSPTVRRNWSDPNQEAVFLVFLNGALASGSWLVSAIFMQQVSSSTLLLPVILVGAAVSITQAVRLFTKCCDVLLLGTPRSAIAPVQKAARAVHGMEGVVRIEELKTWRQSFSDLHLLAKVDIQDTAPRLELFAQALTTLKSAFVHDVTLEMRCVAGNTAAVSSGAASGASEPNAITTAAVLPPSSPNRRLPPRIQDM